MGGQIRNALEFVILPFSCMGLDFFWIFAAACGVERDYTQFTHSLDPIGELFIHVSATRRESKKQIVTYNHLNV